MARPDKVALVAAAVLLSAIVAGVVITYRAPPIVSTAITGAVLRQASDARSQTPIADVEIVATSGPATAKTKSNLSGFFQLTFSSGIQPGQPVTLTLRHPDYQPLQITKPNTEQIYIVRLAPISAAPEAEPHGIEPHGTDMAIGDVRVRYSVKMTGEVNIGSFARTFEVFNTGDVPCNGYPVCSPDRDWRAAMQSVSYDAGEGNEFRDIRVSCIAGPCPFTTQSLSNLGRMMKVSVLDWSDTTTFLVEAEVTRTQTSDRVRYSIPAVFGSGMNFTLPRAAEGPSIEANLNGVDIVFPLGPEILLSWAVCTISENADHSTLYRCQLKPGYRFR